jgi:hypothetical protein
MVRSRTGGRCSQSRSGRARIGQRSEEGLGLSEGCVGRSVGRERLPWLCTVTLARPRTLATASGYTLSTLSHAGRARAAC